MRKDVSGPCLGESSVVSELDLLAGDLFPDDGNKILLEAFPRIAVQIIAELAIVVHLTPAIATPFAAGHVDEEVSVLLVVVNTSVVSVLGASARRESVDHALREEGRVFADPWLRFVELLQSVLLLVFPLHMLLLVGDGIPPDIQHAISPIASLYKEGTKIEARAVLGEYQVDRFRLSIANRASGLLVQVRIGERMADVQRVVLVDVAVDVLAYVVEDMVLQGIG